jgi:diguanylate cyclase (GGDEF)-like protein
MDNSERKAFLNPNYQPEIWDDQFKSEEDASTSEHMGGVVIDAANRLYQTIENAKNETRRARAAEKEAIDKSYVDSLTGCFNANYFNEFKKGVNQDRDNNRLTFVFIDLNDLKNINDNLGHKYGDRLLVNAADFFKKKFREGDIITRIGGDEFVVICYNDNNDENFEDNLNLRVKKLKSEQLQSENPISFAAGVAVYDAEIDKNIDETLKRADSIMYEDKAEMKSGRQR